MENSNEFKKANYRQKVCVSSENGVIFFDPDSQKQVVGAEKMTYDEYLDVQINSTQRTRGYFEMCYFNHTMGFMGQVERIAKDNICFKRIFVSGMFSDGTMFDGKEEHVWMSRNGLEELKPGDCISFFAEVYRYLKTSNGKHIDYSLRNPEGIKKITAYDLPSDDDLMLQEIDQIICETCFLSEHCNRISCMIDPKKRKALRKEMLVAVKGNRHNEEGEE